MLAMYQDVLLCKVTVIVFACRTSTTIYLDAMPIVSKRAGNVVSNGSRDRAIDRPYTDIVTGTHKFYNGETGE